ncbi:hypothetical protein Q73_08205 [Bacillus coahuilensis m2-6]|uniref:hypothetical protein n=1 Tax=Bacillus coahuilensis TaxID=408580 RepID=UPI0007500D0C|nr:hypothetical protein [Bacillus coahuilensis]KUP07783.1 hypothetical protein Q73_08205 [Bacillus coahuilensis m2-6]
MKKLLIALLLCTSTFLTGCLYPTGELSQNQVAYEDQIIGVQNAVDQFQDAEAGLLPIKTKDNDTPIFLKYPIDFNKVVPRFLSAAPGNAFEQGGVFQYVLIHVEEDPTVKILDVRIAEKIREIKIRIQTNGLSTFKNISGNVYTLDFKELGYEEDPFVVSPYTQNNLPFVIDGTGEIYVDYSSDLYLKLQEEVKDVRQGEDIRSILYEDSYFVPAFSLPYTINENNEPVFLIQ